MLPYYPTQRELQRKLKAISNLNLAITPYRRIQHILNKELFMPISVAQLHAGQYVERIRINNGIEIFTEKDKISYIKDSRKIETFGRANAPGQAMFYGSVVSNGILTLARISALAETVLELQGDNKGVSNRKLLMTVGKWKLKKDLIVSELVFNKEAVEKCGDTRRAYETQLKIITEKFEGLQLKQHIALLEFYSKQFARRAEKDTDYKISAAFTECVCRNANLHGIIYPSVQTEFEGTNVALTPEAVETCLELEEALIVSVDIRNTKVFLNNHFRTGLLKANQTSFGWGKAESVSQDVIEEYFLGNNEALIDWKRKMAADK